MERLISPKLSLCNNNERNERHHKDNFKNLNMQNFLKTIIFVEDS
nr:MAG TPA: hypothetical protein [Caudoviricetes sp.]